MRVIERLQEDRFDPNDDAVRHRADEILQVTALNRAEILGAEKRVTEEGKVQYRLPDSEWITAGQVYRHDLV